MANPFLSVLAAYSRIAKHRLIRQTRQVEAAQARFLLTLLRHHQGTEVGQRFHLEEICSVEQFRDRIPILPYSFYEPYAQRIARGETNVLCPDPVRYMSWTSGSTGKQKIVPVTQRFQASLAKSNVASMGFLLSALQSYAPHVSDGQPFGQLLSANSVQVQGYTEAGIPFGPVTVGSLRMGKQFYSQVIAHPYQTLTLGDSLARHYVGLLFALRTPHLRGMAANFPMLILRICDYLATYSESLIADLAQGTLASWLQIEPGLRAWLERRCRPFPQRAAQLQAIVKAEGRLTPKTAWPDFSYVLTARGGTSDFYFQNFPEFFGDAPIFGGVYGAAEATFGVYADVNADGSILALESGFYEFVPSDQWAVEQPRTLMPSEVQVGQRYRILVTSYSGFYRYDIGDVVEVVGFYEQAPLIVFRHRQGGFISSTTEKTTEFHVTQVMQQLQAAFQLRLDDFCVTLSADVIPAAYLVNIELGAGHTLANPEDFLAKFDHLLSEVNHPYGAARRDQIPSPRLRLLAPGSFTTVRQRQVAKGMSDSQLKFPHISEDRHFLDGLALEQEFRLAAEGGAA
ncbi:GH3 auxin-responsive promoter [Synechococcales cyanobacterium C]|uniref:GH3 auxin-responsive promoter n=1 Tax=Petrachloros mirabilis ULC683 TaxID=2781853 RepID=A0A8K2AC79_9CYAN|nr:GH3 auxin-responsive promoter family protein [Petrachloros mirabilis]NCJ05805.1 GH3 auxin-responsive promoter [Petrachloros mirabilis ULC683]